MRPSKTSDKPNVLFITADQWRGDCLGVAGNPVLRTPAVDALADEGTVFLRHYAAAAPCSPARAAMYTGLQQANNRVVDNGTPLAHRFDNIARAARRAGYLPSLFGYTDQTADPSQYHPNDPILQTYEGVLPGFEVAQSLTEDRAPWRRWLAQQGYGPDITADPYAPAPEGPLPARPARFAAEHSQTAFLAGRFMEWLDEQPKGNAWFAHLSLIHPHPPFAAAAPFHDMYDPQDVPACARAEDNAPHPLTQLLGERQLQGSFLPGLNGLVRDLSGDQLRQIKALYYGMVSEVDAQLGRLFEDLKARGLWENTIIVLTSDHGEMMGDRGVLGKGGIYPQSYHIPLVLRVPGKSGGHRVTRLTSAVDLFPTLCELLQVAPTNTLDGRSLAGYLDGGIAANARDAVLWEFFFGPYMSDDLLAETGHCRADCKTLVRLSDHALYAVSPYLPPSHYDLTVDPEMRHDMVRELSQDPARQAERLALAEQMLAERMALEDQTLAALKLGV
nr:sulfatase-like hydrolase/transferase [uncultured Celeribacter sp.]